MTTPSSPRFSSLTRVTLFSAALSLSLTACAPGLDGTEDCTGGKCDGFSDVLDKLQGRADPIATYLKTLDISLAGQVKLDYEQVLKGVAGVMGCSEDSVAVFTVSDDLITGSAFPRLISVACSDDASKASDFFIAASFQNEETGDVDVRDVEMFAWDATARQYMFYAFQPVDDQRVQLDVGPKRCEGCHLTPADTSPTGMRMTPIMNELNRPWTHWNAEPGFPSHEFSVPAGMDEKPHYKALAVAHRAPASRFEEIVKFGGHAKVAAARIRDRRNAPNLDEIMGMLRPVFCNEQINYVSEDHDSGSLFGSSLVDPGLRNMYMQIRPDNWAWDWINNDSIRLGAPGGDGPVIQIPIRGNADIAMETSLVTTKVLTPHQVLRVRALDWQHPVFSDFRCDLWRDANDRFKSSPPDFGTASRASQVMSDIFEQIMSVNGKPLAGSAPETLIMMPDAKVGGDALRAAAEAGTLESGRCSTVGYCPGDVDTLGSELELHMQSLLSSDTRAALRSARQERICHILDDVAQQSGDDRFPEGSKRFPNMPSLPSVDCP